MRTSILISVLALVASASCEPLLYRLAVPAPQYASAALVAPAPAASVYGAPLPAVAPLAQQVAAYPQVASISPVAQVANVAPVGPVASVAPAPAPAVYPTSSVSAYSYGYNVQDYQLVNAAAPASYSLPYSLPYAAYSADWYYRK